MTSPEQYIHEPMDPAPLPEDQSVFEIDHRRNDSIDVTLYWDRDTNSTFVTVDDAKTGDKFVVRTPEDTDPAQVFGHPYSFPDLVERPEPTQ